MKVKELIVKLQEFDGEMEVIYADESSDEFPVDLVEKPYENDPRVYLGGAE